VFEAINHRGDLFSIERVNQLLREANKAEPREMVGVIKDAVNAFMGSAPRTDDVTVLALPWRPAGTATERPIVWAGA
jgi:sigma-B regulation protein RsbU (phosphoserine phosphatase)